MCTHTYALTCNHIVRHAHTCTIHSHMHPHIHCNVHSHTRPQIYSHIRPHIHTYTGTHTYTLAHTDTHTDTHTHTARSTHHYVLVMVSFENAFGDNGIPHPSHLENRGRGELRVERGDVYIWTHMYVYHSTYKMQMCVSMYTPVHVYIGTYT